jgi:hypothetical protein
VEVDPVHEDAPRGRAVEAGRELDRGRLARAVRADEAVDLARRQAEGEAVEGEPAGEPLRQPLEREPRAVYRFSRSYVVISGIESLPGTGLSCRERL